jgi:hypothetical protein
VPNDKGKIFGQGIFHCKHVLLLGPKQHMSGCISYVKREKS